MAAITKDEDAFSMAMADDALTCEQKELLHRLHLEDSGRAAAAYADMRDSRAYADRAKANAERDRLMERRQALVHPFTCGTFDLDSDTDVARFVSTFATAVASKCEGTAEPLEMMVRPTVRGSVDNQVRAVTACLRTTGTAVPTAARFRRSKKMAGFMFLVATATSRSTAMGLAMSNPHNTALFNYLVAHGWDSTSVHTDTWSGWWWINLSHGTRTAWEAALSGDANPAFALTFLTEPRRQTLDAVAAVVRAHSTFIIPRLRGVPGIPDMPELMAAVLRRWKMTHPDPAPTLTLFHDNGWRLPDDFLMSVLRSRPHTAQFGHEFCWLVRKAWPHATETDKTALRTYAEARAGPVPSALAMHADTVAQARFARDVLAQILRLSEAL